MREYSDNIAAEFGELVRRANTGDTVRITVQYPTHTKPSSIEGTIAGVQHGHVCIRNPLTGDTQIPLGDFVVKYEFLTGQKYDSVAARKAYRAALDEKARRDPIGAYMDYLYG